MRSTIRVGITLAMVVVAIFAGSWIWQHYMYSPWTRDARVRAEVVTIAPDVSGWVVELKRQLERGELLIAHDLRTETTEVMTLSQWRAFGRDLADDEEG